MGRVLIVSAETSSCEYIESLLTYWKSRNVSVEAFGVGNQAMQGLGFQCIGTSEEMAFFGSFGILGKYKKLKSIFDALLSEVDRARPDCALLLDYSGFNLKLAAELKARSVPIVYYVSPQVWAWDRGRTAKIKSLVDRMLVLFPFEVDYYRKHGVEAEFVGHPALEKLEDHYLDSKERQMNRARFGFGPDDYVVGFMPGSRMGEVEKHLPEMMEIARRLNKSHQNMKFAFLTSPNFEKQDLGERLSDLRLPYVILKDEPFKMISLADSLVVASGTASLMVALLEKPMVIMYRVSWITGLIGRAFVKVPFIGIVNLIAGRELVPERILGKANAEVITPLLQRFIDEPQYRDQVVSELRELKAGLGADRGATEKVASVVEEYFVKQDSPL